MVVLPGPTRSATASAGIAPDGKPAALQHLCEGGLRIALTLTVLRPSVFSSNAVANGPAV
jgi:hypothetical protein